MLAQRNARLYRAGIAVGTPVHRIEVGRVVLVRIADISLQKEVGFTIRLKSRLIVDMLEVIFARSVPLRDVEAA